MVASACAWCALGHLAGSLAIPLDALRGRLAELPHDRPIVVHCRSGYRAHLALRILRQHGFSDVRNLTGGWLSMALEPALPLKLPA